MTGREIQAALDARRESGGRVSLDVGTHTLTEPLLIDTPSTRLTGEVWAYNLDPNGVFETPFGTKLRLSGRDFPAIRIGLTRPPAGVMVTDLGIQGDILGMDTRGLFDPLHPYASAGLHFDTQRVDQGEFSKISCCGLGVAVCATEGSELDACIFDRINMDGCCVGVYMKPRAAYYAHFRHCIVADTPAWGFYFDGTGRSSVYHVDITDTNFVRNCGSLPVDGEEAAAILLKGARAFTLRDNLIDSPGTYWHYSDDAKDNGERQISKTDVIGLAVRGDGNRILGNVFLGCRREAISVIGNGNILMNNIACSDVVIEGCGNTVSSLAFSSPEARLVRRGAARESTEISGVAPERIVRE